MLYTIGSLVIGAISTGFSLWLKYRNERILREQYIALRKDHQALVNDYNKLVESVNNELETVRKQRDEALQALEKADKPGVFANLLRKRNTGHQDSE